MKSIGSVTVPQEAFVSALAGPLQVVGAHVAVVADPVWVAAAVAVAGDAVPGGGNLVSHQAAAVRPKCSSIWVVMSVTVTGCPFSCGGGVGVPAPGVAPGAAAGSDAGSFLLIPVRVSVDL